MYAPNEGRGRRRSNQFPSTRPGNYYQQQSHPQTQEMQRTVNVLPGLSQMPPRTSQLLSTAPRLSSGNAPQLPSVSRAAAMYAPPSQRISVAGGPPSAQRASLRRTSATGGAVYFTTGESRRESTEGWPAARGAPRSSRISDSDMVAWQSPGGVARPSGARQSVAPFGQARVSLPPRTSLPAQAPYAPQRYSASGGPGFDEENLEGFRPGVMASLVQIAYHLPPYFVASVLLLLLLCLFGIMFVAARLLRRE